MSCVPSSLRAQTIGGLAWPTLKQLTVKDNYGRMERNASFEVLQLQNSQQGTLMA
jgi:hypothetical protein